MVKKSEPKINKRKHCSKFTKNEGECSDGISQTDSIGKNINYENTFQAAKWTFLEYFKESSIHGFKYIGNYKHSFSDRVIWLIALVLSILTCCFLIRNIWYQRINNPVIVSFHEKLTPVWEIPFPSVTICPETKTRTRVFNYTDMLWKIKDNQNITEEEKFYWEAISQICLLSNEDTMSYGNLFTNASDLNQAMTKAAPYENLDECYWRYSTNCSESFQRVVTEDGICLTFNSLTSNYYREELINAHIQDDSFYESDRELNWNVERGYAMGEDLDTFPSRVIGSGIREGLLVYLDSRKEDEEVLCRETLQGFKVILHTPGEEPQPSKRSIHAPVGKSVLISIKPKIVNASEGLQEYAPDRRQCYYQDERYLRYFKVYNQPNCEMECLANKTLDKCGCVKFSMPRNSTHQVCGSRSRDCVSEAESEIGEINFLQANHLNQSDYSRKNLCNCLPLCTSIQYKAELENQSEFDFVGTIRALKMSEVFELYPGLQITEIKIYFKEELFNGLKRSELYSQSDFIANCGGLLGLFMGDSILSLVELVYFFTIKLWSNLKKRKFKSRQLKKFREAP